MVGIWMLSVTFTPASWPRFAELPLRPLAWDIQGSRLHSVPELLVMALVQVSFSHDAMHVA